jgi:hypothetical protein
MQRPQRLITPEAIWNYIRTLNNQPDADENGASIDRKGLWISPILVTYGASAEEARGLAERCVRVLDAPDHPLSCRRVQTLLVAIELIPWMPSSAFRVIDNAGRQAIDAIPSSRRIAQRLIAVKKWESYVAERVPILSMMSKIASDEEVTQEVASVFARWMSAACENPMAVADWIAEVDWGRSLAREPKQPRGTFSASNALNVSMELALAQAHCCLRMRRVPLSAVDGYRKLVDQEGATSAYVMLDSLSACENVEAEFMSGLLASMMRRRCRDADSLVYAARMLDGSLTVLVPERQIQAAKWLNREARSLQDHIGAGESGYVLSVIQRLDPAGRR